MEREPILIVDDTPVNLKLTRVVLANGGFDVRTAVDAEEALRVLEEFRPVLILVDLQLPGMDGLEFTRVVRRNPDFRETVIVALTASVTKEDEGRALAAGCDGHIPKPVDTRKLADQVRGFLHDRRAMQGGGHPVIPVAETTGRVAFPDLSELKQRFILEGAAAARRVLESGIADRKEAQQIAHQWVGAGALLGYVTISALSSRVSKLLLGAEPADDAEIGETWQALTIAFGDEAKAWPAETGSAPPGNWESLPD